MRALREGASEVIHHPDWLDALTQAAGACFDELVGGRMGAGRKGPGRSSPPINLVRDDESDYSIALINLDQRLQDYCGRDLSVLHLRMRQQLADEGVELREESPLGTASVCRALRALKEAERLKPAEALRLLGQLEEPLRRHLGRFYQELEHSFAGAVPARRGPRDEDSEEYWTDTPAARASLPIYPVDALRLAVLAQRENMPTSATSLDPGLASALIERIEAWLGERHNFGSGLPVSLGASELGAPPQEVVATSFARARAVILLVSPQFLADD